MADEDVIHVNEGNFEEEVLKSAVPVLVDFWATWCGPCIMVAPVIEELATELKGKVKVAKVNTDENAEIATRYGIMSIPTLLVIRNGEVKAQRVGVCSKEDMLGMIESAQA